MRKYLIFCSLLLALFLASNKKIFADIPPPDSPFPPSCNYGEKKITSCYVGPFTNSCSKYVITPRYRKIEYKSGWYVYCYKPSDRPIENILFYLKDFLFYFSLTLFLEVPIFLLAKFRSIRSFIAIGLANLISVAGVYIISTNSPLRWHLEYNTLLLLIYTFLIIIFEFLFLKFTLKKIKTEKIILATFLANATSAIIGSQIIKMLSLH